jgi:hypothetical protein
VQGLDMVEVCHPASHADGREIAQKRNVRDDARAILLSETRKILRLVMTAIVAIDEPTAAIEPLCIAHRAAETRERWGRRWVARRWNESNGSYRRRPVACRDEKEDGEQETPHANIVMVMVVPSQPVGETRCSLS